MDKSKERLTFMTQQLHACSLTFVRQQGIDGKTYNFDDLYDEQLSIKKNGSPLVAAEKGCALSHLTILQEAKRDNLDYVLILEDDVEIPKNFGKIIHEVIEKREQGLTSWEYLAFNYPTVGYKFMRLWLFLLLEQFKKNPSVGLYLKIPSFIIKGIVLSCFSLFEGLRDALFKKIYPHGLPSRFYRPTYLAGCYLVTATGITKLLQVQPKLIYPADRIQNVARVTEGLKLFHFVPLLVKQRRDKFESTMYENKDYVFSKYD